MGAFWDTAKGFIFGKRGKDYAMIEDDGTLILRGNATAWDDLWASVGGLRINSAAGSVDFDYDENAIEFQANGNINNANDRAIITFPYPHACKTDGVMRLHIHWEQTDATPREFTVRYRIQSNGMTKNTDWTTMVVSTGGDNDLYEYTSGTLNQYTRITDIDMTGAGLSATVDIQGTRSDSVAGTILVKFVDAHVEFDSLGSREELVK